jgi:CHRD domain
MKLDHNKFVNIGSTKFVIIATLCFSLVVIITVTNIMSPTTIQFPSFVLAQVQQNFTSNLNGQDVVPPVNTEATGTSEFTLSSDGKGLNYEVYVTNIEDITLAQIYQGQEGKNGSAITTLIRFKELTPTGPVNGLLAQGVITADELLGPLRGKQISDLTDLIEDNNAYVEVHTTEYPNGEIRGQILD